jgi:hypothetical protein
MSDSVVGNCLHLYLQHYALISSLEDQEFLPAELKEEEKLLSSFSAKASDQAAALLEALYSQLGSALPYRIQRRSQRRTVREQWRMDGPFLRAREKMARNFWSLYLGCLREKGPAACLVLGPSEPNEVAPIDSLSNQIASLFGIESANARTCFDHDSGYECGVVIATAMLSPSSGHETVGAEMKEAADHFFAKYRAPFEQAIDGA